MRTVGCFRTGGLGLQVLDHHLAGEAHVFEARVELVEYEYGYGRVADFFEVGCRVDDGGVAGGHLVLGGGLEAADGLGLLVFEDGEVVAGEIAMIRLPFLSVTTTSRTTMRVVTLMVSGADCFVSLCCGVCWALAMRALRRTMVATWRYFRFDIEVP